MNTEMVLSSIWYNFDESEKSQSLFIPNHEPSRGSGLALAHDCYFLNHIRASSRAIDYADDVLFEEIVVIITP